EGLDRFGEFVAPHLPGILLLQWGINDCYVHTWQRISRVSLGEFRRNLTEMVCIARERHSRPVLVIGHPILAYGIFPQGNGRSQPENFAPYGEAIRALAAELKTDAIDLPAELQARGIAPAQFVAADGVHLSELGHRVYAEIVLAALRPILSPN
ncbi:MAG: GDSL-type esterase/lipase family protein, partial [Verrucomicrobiota bacterium]